MATTIYSGNIGAAQALNYTRTVNLSGGSQINGSRIDSVVAAAFLSTNAYTNTYQVRARLLNSGGGVLAEVIRYDIKFVSTNYTGATWYFDFGTNVDVNSIASIAFFGLNEASKIFVKDAQSVTIGYTVRTACGAPNAVWIGAGEADPGAAIGLYWSGQWAGDANAIVGYKIGRSEDGGAWNDNWATAGASGVTVYAHPTWGHYYDYRIITDGEYIDSGASGSVRLSTRVPTACGAPSAASVSPALAETDPTLTSSGAASGTLNGITGYEIQYSDSADNSIWGPWTALKTVGTSSGSLSTSVALPGTRGYWRKYRLRTLGAAGESYYSAWRDTGAIRRNSLPTAPTSFVASPAVYVSGPISLSYPGATDPDGNITTHNVQYALSNDGTTWGAWTALADGSTSHTPTLQPSQYIKYQARAVDSTGAVSTFTQSNICGKNTAPGNPTINYPQAGKTIHNSRPRFLMTLGVDPEAHLQSILADGYTASRASNLDGGAKIILRKTSTASAGTVSISAQAADIYGELTAQVTRDTTYAMTNYTDAAVEKGTTQIKAAHMTELRAMVNTIRAYYGLSAVVWAESITGGITKTRNWVEHISELRTAITDIVMLVNGWDTLSTTGNIPTINWVAIRGRQPQADVMAQIRSIIPTL